MCAGVRHELDVWQTAMCIAGAWKTATLAVMVIMPIFNAATSDGLRRGHRPDTAG